MSKRLVVTGTRQGRADVWLLLDEFVQKYGVPSMVLVGDARGVDEDARAWALARGIPLKVFKADWETHGRSAGPLRNSTMVNAAEPGDWCLAFPKEESRGTRDCVRKAKIRGLSVFVL